MRRGFPTDEEDAQRRIIMADLATPQGTLTVINGYFPQGESRDHPIKFPAKTRFIRICKTTWSSSCRRSPRC